MEILSQPLAPVKSDVDVMPLAKHLSIIARTFGNQGDPVWSLIGRHVEAMARRASYLEAETAEQFEARSELQERWAAEGRDA